jgi:hypothetical protein
VRGGDCDFDDDDRDRDEWMRAFWWRDGRMLNDCDGDRLSLMSLMLMRLVLMSLVLMSLIVNVCSVNLICRNNRDSNFLIFLLKVVFGYDSYYFSLFI